MYEGRGFMPDRTASFKAPANPSHTNPTQARRKQHSASHPATATNKTRGRRKVSFKDAEIAQDVPIASLPMVPPSIENGYIRRKNPPVVVFIWGSVSVCSGCPDNFKRNQMKPPYNMVF